MVHTYEYFSNRYQIPTLFLVIKHTKMSTFNDKKRKKHDEELNKKSDEREDNSVIVSNTKGRHY